MLIEIKSITNLDPKTILFNDPHYRMAFTNASTWIHSERKQREQNIKFRQLIHLQQI